MFKILQVLSIFFIAFISVSNAENEESIDVLEALNLKEKKYLFASPKTTKKIFESTIARINNDCCDEDFPKKKRIIEIKETIEKCLSTKCQNKLIPIYVPKKPPLKLIASGGISTFGELPKLAENGCEGVIIGKAIYENKISLKQLENFIIHQ